MGKLKPVQSAQEFFDLLSKSRLLDQTMLDRVAKLTQQTSDAKAVARHLIKHGVVTQWQAQQLLGGWHQLYIGKYKLYDQLEKGDLGRTFAAEHPQMGRRVAIRTLSSRNTANPELVERFLADARRAASLDHRNIIHVYDVAREGDRYYVVTELVDGKDLHVIVDAEGPLDPTRALDYVQQAAQGLAHAHERGVIHRDIKPTNLLVDANGVVKILGMGVGLLAEQNGPMEGDSGPFVPSAYSAPEQTSGNADASDPRVDLFSLGCTAGFLMTGAAPSDGTSVVPDDVAPEIAELLGSMTAVEVESRPTAAHVADRLDAWLRDNAFGDLEPLEEIESLEEIETLESPADSPAADPLDLADTQAFTNPSGGIDLGINVAGKASDTVDASPFAWKPDAKPAKGPATPSPAAVSPASQPDAAAPSTPAPVAAADAGNGASASGKAKKVAKSLGAGKKTSEPAVDLASLEKAASPAAIALAADSGAPSPFSFLEPAPASAAASEVFISTKKKKGGTREPAAKGETPAAPSAAAAAPAVPAVGATGAASTRRTGKKAAVSLPDAKDQPVAKGAKGAADAAPDDSQVASDGGSVGKKKLPIALIIGGGVLAGLMMLGVVGGAAFWLLSGGKDEPVVAKADNGAGKEEIEEDAGEPSGDGESFDPEAAWQNPTDIVASTGPSNSATGAAPATGDASGGTAAQTPAATNGGNNAGGNPATGVLPSVGSPATPTSVDPSTPATGTGDGTASTLPTGPGVPVPNTPSPGPTATPAGETTTPTVATPGSGDPPPTSPPTDPPAETAKPTPSPMPTPPPTPAPAKNPKADKPFAELPTAISLPPLESGAAPSFVPFGPLYSSAGDLCFMQLMGGDHALKPNTAFTLENARSGTAEREWEFKLSGVATEPIVIAQMKLEDDQLLFQWTAEGIAEPSSANLCNTRIHLTMNSHQHDINLRQPTTIGPVNVTLLKAMQPQRINLDLLPEVEYLKVEIIGIDGAFPKFVADPPKAISATNGTQTLAFGEKPEDQLLQLKVDSSLKGKALELKMLAQMKTPGAVKPDRFVASKLGQQKQLVQGGLNALTTQLINAANVINKAPQQQRAVLEQQKIAAEQQQQEMAQFLAQLEALETWVQATGDGGALRLRVFYDANGTEIDIARTDAAPIEPVAEPATEPAAAN